VTLSFDLTRNVYILDKVNRRVARFDAAGSFLGNVPYPQDWHIWDLAADKEGNIYLYDRVNGNIGAVDPAGELLREFPRPARSAIQASGGGRT